MLYQLQYTFLVFILYSFAGWVWETIICSVNQRQLVNRGFLNGPLCPIYGSGAMLVIWTLGDITGTGSVLALFLSSMAVTGFLEYMTSYVMEKLFHTRWWDYSHYRFNLNGRISLLGLVAFGVMSVLLLLFVHPALTGFLARFSPLTIAIVSSVLFVIFAVDLVYTTVHLLQRNSRLKEMQEIYDQRKAEYRAELERVSAELQQALDTYVAEQRTKSEERQIASDERKAAQREAFERYTEEVRSDWNNWLQSLELTGLSEKTEKYLSKGRFQDRRLSQAFPRMDSNKYHEALQRLKDENLRRKLNRKKK